MLRHTVFGIFCFQRLTILLSMYKVVIILLLTACHAVTAGAQSFLERLQKPVRNQGTVTVHQDAAIDKLVNGPYTAPATKKVQQTNNEKTTTASTDQKKTTVKPATVTDNKPKSNTADKQNTMAKNEPEKASAEQQKDTSAADDDARKKVMRNSYKVTGFRVQAYAGGNTRQDRQTAEQVGNNIKANIPGEPVYVHFYSPRWICRVGNYRTYEEAHQMLLAIRKLGYKQASIVKGKISVQY